MGGQPRHHPPAATAEQPQSSSSRAQLPMSGKSGAGRVRDEAPTVLGRNPGSLFLPPPGVPGGIGGLRRPGTAGWGRAGRRGDPCTLAWRVPGTSGAVGAPAHSRPGRAARLSGPAAPPPLARARRSQPLPLNFARPFTSRPLPPASSPGRPPPLLPPPPAAASGSRPSPRAVPWDAFLLHRHRGAPVPALLPSHLHPFLLLPPAPPLSRPRSLDSRGGAARAARSPPPSAPGGIPSLHQPPSSPRCRLVPPASDPTRAHHLGPQLPSCPSRRLPSFISLRDPPGALPHPQASSGKQSPTFSRDIPESS